MIKIDIPLSHNNPRYDHVTSWSDASAPQPDYTATVHCACGRLLHAFNKRLNDDYTECEECRDAIYCECGEEITDENPASDDDYTRCLSCDTQKADFYLDAQKDPD